MRCELNSGMYFSIISRTFKHSLDEAAREKGLTGVQLMVMAQLHRLEHEGVENIRQRDLENAVHLSHPTMTELLKRLEKKGFVECTVCASDRRSKLIRSTPCAQAFHEEMNRIDQTVYEQLCQGLSPQQQQQLKSILNTMLENAFTMRKEVCQQDD